MVGDLMDRGKEALQMQDFILDLLIRDEIILIRGNHEDLFEEFLLDDEGCPDVYTGLPVKTTSEKIIVNIGVLS